jgi:maternal-effect protein oskar
MAVFDLNFKKTCNVRNRQSGHCVSGLRIADATERIADLEEPVEYVIVNVGSVDIAEGRQLIQMVTDMRELIATCAYMDITPIITTLAPLPNYLLGNRKDTLNWFNQYIRMTLSQSVAVIDLNLCMLADNASVNLNFYQTEPRSVRGSKKPFVLWNKIGRTRILDMLIKNLGGALILGSDFVGNYF